MVVVGGGGGLTSRQIPNFHECIPRPPRTATHPSTHPMMSSVFGSSSIVYSFSRKAGTDGSSKHTATGGGGACVRVIPGRWGPCAACEEDGTRTQHADRGECRLRGMFAAGATAGATSLGARAALRGAACPSPRVHPTSDASSNTLHNRSSTTSVAHSNHSTRNNHRLRKLRFQKRVLTAGLCSRSLP